jgi:hypothetical protein
VFAEVTDVFPKLGLWVTWGVYEGTNNEENDSRPHGFSPNQSYGSMPALDHPRPRGQNTSCFPNQALRLCGFQISWLFSQSKNSEHWTIAVLQRQSDALILYLISSRQEKTPKICGFFLSIF